MTRILLSCLLALPLCGFGPVHRHGDHAAPALPAETPAQAGKDVVLNIPPKDMGADTLEARGQAERASVTAGKFKVFHDFRFTDRLPESGITFVHQIVDDAGKTYKAAHYDHGNGVAVADVDGDGRTDVYFTSQMGGNELWKNLGGGKFKNVTAEAGVALPGKVSVTASFADVDNDGDEDLYVTTVRMGNSLFLNDGKGKFRDATQASGLGYTGHSSGAVFFDYDRDGRLDLFLVNVGKYTTEARGRGGYYVAYEDAFNGHMFPDRTETSILYRNLGGNKFQDVSKETGLVDGTWSGDATIADFNEDGWPDLYVLNMQGDNHYWENQGGKTFVEKAAQYFPKTPWGAMGIKSFDYDNDGRMDLLLTDMHSDMVGDMAPQDEKLKFPPKEENPVLQGADNNIFGNAFYKNLGGGRFAEMLMTPFDWRFMLPVIPLLCAAMALILERLVPWRAFAIALLLPGFLWGTILIAKFGLPRSRDAFLARRIPVYRALQFTGSNTVYVLQASNGAYYCRGRCLGDLLGPYAYDRILPLLTDPPKLAATLRGFGARYLIVTQEVNLPFRRVYADDAATVFDITSGP